MRVSRRWWFQALLQGFLLADYHQGLGCLLDCGTLLVFLLHVLHRQLFYYHLLLSARVPGFINLSLFLLRLQRWKPPHHSFTNHLYAEKGRRSKLRISTHIQKWKHLRSPWGFYSGGVRKHVEENPWGSSWGSRGGGRRVWDGRLVRNDCTALTARPVCFSKDGRSQVERKGFQSQNWQSLR